MALWVTHLSNKGGEFFRVLAPGAPVLPPIKSRRVCGQYGQNFSSPLCFLSDCKPSQFVALVLARVPVPHAAQQQVTAMPDPRERPMA
jgi:hypothetical protein